MQQVSNRWYLYLAHLWHSGWSVLDVTDPERPELVNYIPGPPDTMTIQIQVAGGKMITSLEKPLPGWYALDAPFNTDNPFTEGAYIWDVATDPTEPRLLGHYRTGGLGTHRNYYAGGRYVYMTANPEGFKGHCLTIVDIDDPTNPTEIGRWWWPGQAPTDPEPGTESFYFHGPAYVVGDRAYLSYGRLGLVILDIADPTQPRLVAQTDFGDLGSFLGTHSAVPVHGTNLLVVNSEAILEGDADPLNYVFVVDISDETRPRVISSLPQPAPSPGLPYQNYFEKGGRFGPHNQHHYQFQTCLHKPQDLIFLTYFNAGLRVYSIADPLRPVEVGCFVPADPPKRLASLPEALVVQFEDVLVDARGYIYCTDKNYGLFILRYEGL